ncbi:helix-turn-helix domain-containing protein [Nocardioides sp. NPDC051685]|uniref:helix-turn-helix domain-containing protein n=1 Tax=Nocardioides sp. NPDC051685 TaxID=3364334 RepID=UPI00379C342E
MSIDQVPFSQRDGEELLTFAEVAEVLKVSPNTLRWWRQQNTGPELFKMGRRLVSTVGDVRRFMREQRLASRRLI